jgi:4-amino-4-deoxy-L-arabinose transferase-like glycosyltransferase
VDDSPASWTEERRSSIASVSETNQASSRSLAFRCSAVVACALVIASLALLWTELTYDEAVYLRLARTIAECGLPLRRAYEDFSRFQLFANSPPLVLYVASVSQWLFPGHDVPTRFVHIALFVLPTFALLWRTAHVRFGDWAAVASLLALLTAPFYMRETSHISLNIPLGLFACISLLAFHDASCSPSLRLSLIAGLSLALAVWTKYQAVCLAAGMVAYVVHTLWTRGYAGLRSTLLALSVVVVCGAVAVAALAAYFWTFGGRETLTATLTWNVGRFNPSSMSALAIAGGVILTARESVSHLGGPALLLGIVALCAEHRERGLVVILASYVAATIGFNLLLFRLPGAGATYLDGAVPALALLAGPGAVRVIAMASTTAARTALALTAMAIQLAGSPAYAVQRPRPNGTRVAAAYIAAHSPATAGVLAETVAIEFYSGRPVRAVPFTHPKELIVRSLEGTSGDDISFVVIRAGAVPANLDSIRQQWETLLSRHFEIVSIGAPGLHVYRRKRQ